MQEASATEISERAGAIAADAQADLDKALPALAAAVQCLKELKKAHIDEVKALKKPPGGVRLTLEVACVFFEVAPVKKPDPEDPSKKIFDYVEPAGKSLLSNAGKFLEMLQDFDKDFNNDFNKGFNKDIMRALIFLSKGFSNDSSRALIRT